MWTGIPVGLVTILGVAAMLTACYPPTPRAANVELPTYANAIAEQRSYTAPALIRVMRSPQQSPG